MDTQSNTLHDHKSQLTSQAHTQPVNSRIQTCQQYLTQLLTAHNVDHTHGIQHVLIVTNHAYKAVEALHYNITQTQRQNIILACLLHDADDRKYFPSSNNYSNARHILSKLQLSSERQDAQARVQSIIQMISLVSYSKNGDNIDPKKPEHFYYPRYCDRIDAIGYKGIVRCYQYSKVTNNPLVTQQTERPNDIQSLKEICRGRNQIYIRNGGKSRSVIDHIYDKLLHLKLPSSIKNPYINQMYKQRQNEIIQFVLRHAKDGFCGVQKQMESYLQKSKKQRFG